MADALPRYAPDEVTALLKAATRARCAHDFTCGLDVHTWLMQVGEPADPLPAWSIVAGQQVLAQLMSVPVIVDELMPPREFRLVRHDSCDVHADAGTVTHHRCFAVTGVMAP